MGMNLASRGNDNSYFNCTIWTWQTILSIIDYVNEKDNLEFDTSNWDYNDGHGLKSAKQSRILAHSISNFMKEQEASLYIYNHPSLGEPSLASPYRVDKETLEEFIIFLYNCKGFRIW